MAVDCRSECERFRLRSAIEIQDRQRSIGANRKPSLSPLPPKITPVAGQDSARVSIPEEDVAVEAVVGEQVFVGREAELIAIKTALLVRDDLKKPVAICALQGMPGVGKSYLVDQFAFVNRYHFPGGYLRLPLAADEERGASELRGVLSDRLRLPADSADGWGRLRARLLSPLTLLHIENADGEQAARVAAQMATALKGCAVVVTGRYQGLGMTTGWTRLPLAPFDEATSVKQLSVEFRPAANQSEKDAFCMLAGALGHLPLALHLAAGYLRIEGDVTSFLALLRSTELHLEPSDPADPLLLRDPARAVLATTFDLSLKLLLRTLGERGAHIVAGFHALGSLPPSGFGRSLGAAVTGLTSDEFSILTIRAQQLSLLERVQSGSAGEPRWRIHPLIGEFLSASADKTAVHRRMSTWFLERLGESKDGSAPPQRDGWRQIEAETDALVAWLASADGELWEEIERAGSHYARLSGPFRAWMAFLERALKTELAPIVRAHFLTTLSDVARQTGDYARASSSSDEAIKISERLRNPTLLVEALCARAHVLAATGKPEAAARTWVQEILPLANRFENVSNFGPMFAHLGVVLVDLGRYDEALALWKDKALPAFDAIGASESRAIVLVQIALVLIRREAFDEAQRVLDDALPVLRGSGMTREYAVARDAVAQVLRGRKRHDEALAIWRDEVIPTFERLGNESDLAVMRSKMAHSLAELGRVDEALELERNQVIPVFERIGNHRARAVSLNWLALELGKRRQYDEALRLQLNEILPIFEQVPDQREIVITCYNAAQILVDRGRSSDRAEAGRLAARALVGAQALRIPEMASILTFLLAEDFLKPSDVIKGGRAIGAEELAVRIVGTRGPQEVSYVSRPRVGRNDPCPCGSGRKYKKCHGA